jgi:hypothetical protein
VTDALRQHAPICQDRLHPDQRHAVLRPAHLPRRVVPMQPRRPAHRPQSHFSPILAGLWKMAAVLVISGMAYWLGGRQAQEHPISPVMETVAQVETPAPTQVSAPAARNERPAPDPMAPTPSNAVATVAPEAPALVEAPPPVEKQPVEVISAVSASPSAPDQPPASKPAPLPKSPPAAPAPFLLRPNSNLAFTPALKKEVDEVSIRPADILPPQRKSQPGNVLASPISAAAKAQTEAAPRRPAQEIYIHAWRAEVASCPWNADTRLLRITIQLPPSQALADKTASFPLQVAFDRRLVREFRRLGQRSTPAAEMDSAGVQTFWYEFLPAGDEAVRNGRALATVTLEKGRFTLPSPGPFSGAAKLAVLDRGTAWTAARDDFLYEAALIGFGALLRGDHQSPGLNYQTVLSIAEKSRVTDTTGERARFIRSLEEARKAAGL